MTFLDITGQRFGRLVAVERIGTKKYPSGGTLSIWKCKCDCGNYINVPLPALKEKNTTSCGCLQKELIGSLNKTHGLSHTRLHEVWKQMKKRCSNPRCREYQFYGAKGVRVCDEWEKSFSAFRDWMLKNGYKEDAPRGECTIDRINPFGNYEPSNCRIVDMKTQLHNLRKNYENNS